MPVAASEPNPYQERARRLLRRPRHLPYTGATERPARRVVDPTDRGYGAAFAAAAAGVSDRQLSYWAQIDLVRPRLATSPGRGAARRYSYGDLLELRLVKVLVDHGLTLASIRDAFALLDDVLSDDLTGRRVVIAGGSALLVQDDEQFADVLDRDQGPSALDVIELQRIKDEVDSAIARIRAGDPSLLPRA